MTQTYSNQLKGHIGESVTFERWQVEFLFVIAFILGSYSCKFVTANDPEVTPSNQLVSSPTAHITPEKSEQEKVTDNEPTMPILKEIEKYKKNNPSSTNQNLADWGNTLLPTMGFEFDIDLGKQVAVALKSKNLRKVNTGDDELEYFYLTVPLKTASGINTSLKIVAPTFESCCCGYTYVPIPVTQVSATRLTVVIDSKPTVIVRTKDLPVVQEYILYENEDKPKKVRSWEAPFEAYPYGLSDDGTSVYFETELNEILLEVSALGKLRFVAKESSGIVTQKEDIRKITPPKLGGILVKSGEFGLYKYIVAGKPYFLEFPYICT